MCRWTRGLEKCQCVSALVKRETGGTGILSVHFSPGRIGVLACTLQIKAMDGGFFCRHSTGEDAYAPRGAAIAQARTPMRPGEPP